VTLAAAWEERVRWAFAGAPRSKFVVGARDSRLVTTTVVDWPALPLRVVLCLGRARALELPDSPGGRRLQEEYLEWRVVRDTRDRSARIELTTEFADTWRVLAAHAPRRALATLARFAGERAVPIERMFGDVDPFARGVTPDDREQAFIETMLGGGRP
jgi:hypothetical protein